MRANTVMFPKGGKFRLGNSGRITLKPGMTLSGMISPYLVEGKHWPIECFDLMLADGRWVMLIPYAKVTFLLEGERV